jgi:hypothetical protein
MLHTRPSHPQSIVASTSTGPGGCGRTHRFFQLRLSGSYKGSSRPETGRSVLLDSTPVDVLAVPAPIQSTITVLPIYLHLYSINNNLHFSFFAAIRIISVVPPRHKLEHVLALIRHTFACTVSLSRNSPACVDTSLTPFILFLDT